MTRTHVKKNDEVVVIAGAERGKRGKVIHVYPSTQRVIVEGLKMIHRHTRKNAQNPNGAIVKREGTIHVSNVMPAATFDARKTKRTGAAPAAE